MHPVHLGSWSLKYRLNFSLQRPVWAILSPAGSNDLDNIGQPNLIIFEAITATKSGKVLSQPGYTD